MSSLQCLIQMLATSAKLESATSTSLAIRIHKVSIALATCDLDQVALDLDLERILLKFNELAPAPVDAQRLFKVLSLTATPRHICNSLITIH